MSASSLKVPGTLLACLLALAIALTTAGTAAAFPGQFDPAFGTDGAMINQFSSAPSPLSIGVDVAPAPEGKVVACGEIADPEGHIALGVVRYLADGALDPSFGTGGVVIMQLGLEGEVEGKKTTPESACLYSGLAVLPDGRIEMAGAATDKERNFTTLVVRLKANGELDPTFAGGFLRQQLGNTEFAKPVSEFFGLAVQPDGKTVLAGFGTDKEGRKEFVAERLTSGGVPDPGFGKAGVFRQQFGKFVTEPRSAATDVIVQPSGQLVFSGQANLAEEGFGFALVALTSAGKLNPGFGTTGGVTVTQPGVDPTGESTAYRLVEQSSGRFVLGGIAPFDEAGDLGYAVAGFTASGQVDPSFGTGGATLTPLSTAENRLPRESAWCARPMTSSCCQAS
jgi:uncharacterized delta-60 repeat protein